MSHDIFDHTSPTPTGALVPIAEPIPNPEEPHFPVPPHLPPVLEPPFRLPLPHLCIIDLPEGCYRISHTPAGQLGFYQGTLRVDKAGGQTVVSGDLYWQPPFLLPPHDLRQIPFPTFPKRFGIPIYARNRYHSYLKVTGLKTSPVRGLGPCQLTLTAEQYNYTQPPAGSFNGTFPAAPSRTVSLVLSPQAAPAGFGGSYFAGSLFENGVDKGAFTMGWVSKFFRTANIEIDTLTGSVAPQAVPALSGGGTEDIRSTFATGGWDVKVTYDQTSVPVPAGVTATSCWSDANLHALMLNVRKQTTDLDKEWRLHVLVVPAQLGCGRGVMYDQIGVPREGVASFSDDGYPTGDSSNFGAAANRKQRDVPRAFMRSACHEIGHGFNQVHQENEAGSDNSIMTTSPGVANFLGGPATGAAGVFPTDIALRFNEHVRHHLVHFPDPVVRPGGMTFGTGHGNTVPQADINRYFFEPEEIELKIALSVKRIKLGQPLPVSWEIVNRSKHPIPAPSDIGLAAQHAFLSVIDEHEHEEQMPSFKIQTDTVSIKPLKPGATLGAGTDLFWSSEGFAFKTPGTHTIQLRVIWNYGGADYGVRATAEVFVDYPVSEADNAVAAQLMHGDVGMFVALGGGAGHLHEAVGRIEKAAAAHAEHPACLAMKTYCGHKFSLSRRSLTDAHAATDGRRTAGRKTTVKVR